MTDTVPGPGQAVTTDTATKKPTYSAGLLRAHADKVAPGWHVAHKPKGAGSFGRRIDATAESLDQLYVILDARPTPTYEPGVPLDPLLELRQNPRLLRSVLTEISSVRKKLGHLPRVLRERENDEPRIVTVGDAYLQAVGSDWNADAIKIFLDRVQQYDALELEELWKLPTVLKFLLLEEIITQSNGVIKEPESHTEGDAELLKTRMRSLRDVGYADWFTLIEPLVVYDSCLLYTSGILWQSGPAVVTWGIILRIVVAALPSAIAIVAAWILYGVQLVFSHKGLRPHFWWMVGLEAVLNVTAGLISRAVDYSDSLLADRYTHYVSVRVMRQAAELDLTTYEDPVFYDRLERARVQATDRLAMICLLYTSRCV